VVDKLAFEIWRRFAQPDPIVTGAISAIVGVLVAFYAYTNPQSRKLADEVVAELGQVTWPSRDETYVSTVVVVVTSVVAAVYTGLFDALWSAVTDFVYTV
jgi:preprotein translocase SecE subunit